MIYVNLLMVILCSVGVGFGIATGSDATIVTNCFAVGLNLWVMAEHLSP